MLSDATKALAQMFTPSFRTVLLKSVGLAVLVLVMLGIGLQRVFAWLSAEGAGYLEGITGAGWHTPMQVLLWIVTVTLGIGLFAGAIFVMPAVTAFVASFFSDEIAADSSARPPRRSLANLSKALLRLMSSYSNAATAFAKFTTTRVASN